MAVSACNHCMHIPVGGGHAYVLFDAFLLICVALKSLRAHTGKHISLRIYSACVTRVASVCLRASEDVWCMCSINTYVHTLTHTLSLYHICNMYIYINIHIYMSAIDMQMPKRLR